MADKKDKWTVGGHLGRNWGKYSWLPLLYEGAKWSWGGKEGGRVTHRGIGRAKRGCGRVMRNKRK
jgi:hypothetical protein